MAGWIDNKFADLARQLTYSPAEKRALQLEAGCALLALIEPEKSYPWEFILFRVTGYRPREALDHALAGRTIQADLSRLIEVLSNTLRLRSAEAAEPVLSLDEVVRQFGVCAKTIQRWRRQGLLAQRFVFPDGRRRIGFLKSTVEHFAQSNTRRVQEATSFRQMSGREREMVLRFARRLVKRGRPSLTEITRKISQRLARSTETIRYTIRRFDQENPQAAIFPPADGPISPEQRREILAHFDQGVSVDRIARQFDRTRSSIYRLVSQERGERLKALAIEYIHNPLFDHPDAEQIILRELPAAALAQARQTVGAGQNAKAQDMLVARVPENLPAALAQIFNQPVMPQEMEIDAFRRMNYLKHKAKWLQAALEPAQASSSELSEIDSLLAQARTLSNQIVQSNLRIAVHVARRHQQPWHTGGWGNADVMELVSDASIWLMRAAERFDFARGVKFSTYASYAIMKNFARDRVEQIARRDARLVTGQEETLEQIRARENRGVAEQVDALQTTQQLSRVIQKLPARERELVSAHYGLDPARPALSLAQLAAKMGITKARVRQIETRALRQLRRLMEEGRGGRVNLSA